MTTEEKNKEEKIKLIREIENTCGFARFKVTRKSSMEEIDNVLNFIEGSYTEYKDSFSSLVQKLIND